MTMLPCKECRNGVSSKAKVCPHCGCKFKGSLIGGLFKTVLFTGLIMFVLLVGMAAFGPKQKTPEEHRAEIRKQIWDRMRAEREARTEQVILNEIANDDGSSPGLLLGRYEELQERWPKPEYEKKVAYYQAKVLEGRRGEGVSIGMSAERVLQSNWGRPERVNRTTSAHGKREQWVYSAGRYLYFEDGILTAIQD